MKLSRKDYFTVAAVLVLVLVLALGGLKGKGKKVPYDVRHVSVYQALQQGRSRSDTELCCTTCHSKSSLPLPGGHPPKEQCLLCHHLDA